MATMNQSDNYYRRGLGLKAEVKPVLAVEYGSALVEAMKASDHELKVGRLTFRMAKSLGFCYGVDRAVEYAYETCRKFPDRRIFLVGEIIHNPLVNRQLESMGVVFLYPDDAGNFDFAPVEQSDVVILPAFGVAIDAFERLRDIDCVLVDTTCGSVLRISSKAGRVNRYTVDLVLPTTLAVRGPSSRNPSSCTSPTPAAPSWAPAACSPVTR